VLVLIQTQELLLHMSKIDKSFQIKLLHCKLDYILLPVAMDWALCRASTLWCCVSGPVFL